MAIGREIEELIGKRQGQRTDLLPATLREVPAGKETAEVAAERCGFGGVRTYEKAKAVVEAAEEDTAKREHVLKLNIVRRHLEPHEWGAAFAKLLELRGVKRGQGARNDQATSPKVGQVAEELGVVRSTAFDRLALADIYQALPVPERHKVDAGEKTVRGAKRDVEHVERKARTPLWRK